LPNCLLCRQNLLKRKKFVCIFKKDLKLQEKI